MCKKTKSDSTNYTLMHTLGSIDGQKLARGNFENDERMRQYNVSLNREL